MARPIEFNRNRLHALLKYRSDYRGVLGFNQRTYAAEIGISPFHFNRVLQDFVATGRLRRLSAENRHLQTYIVTDPVEYCNTHHDLDGAVEAQEALDYFGSRPSAADLNAAFKKRVEVAIETINPFDDDGEIGYEGTR